MFQTKNPVLIIIDCQVAIDSFHSSTRSNPDAEFEISQLLTLWQNQSLPVIHIRHSSKSDQSPYHASKPTFAFKEEVMPLNHETVITKSENCAFIGTELKQVLESLESHELVICGVLTHNSVDATIRHAAAVGYQVIVPANCTASFAITLADGRSIESELVQEIFLANLNGEYCTVASQITNADFSS